MKSIHVNILKRLDAIINDTANNIHDFISDPHAFIRKRKLDAATLMKTIINMQGNSLAKELFDCFDDDSDQMMSVSAFVQQKSKLSPACFKHILVEFNKKLFHIKLFDDKYRLLAIDGSDFNQLFDPKSKNIITKQFPQPICQIHVNAMYDLLNNTYQDCIFQPKAQMDERSAAIDMLKKLNIGPYVVLMDRGYSSFNMIENCNRLTGCYYVIRSKAGKGAFKEIKALPDKECDVSVSCRVTDSNYYYTTHKNKENIHLVMHNRHHYKKCFSKNTQDAHWDFGPFCTVKFRACKIRINDNGKDAWEVLLTNLSPRDYPLSKMKRLYYMRWGIESSFRKLKYDLGSVQFHSKQDRFIEMEIYAHMIMFNTVSQTNAQAAVPQRNCKYDYEINFKMACVIIHKRYLQSSSDLIFERILTEIGSRTVPIRPGRRDKRKMKPQAPVNFIYRVA